MAASVRDTPGDRGRPPPPPLPLPPTPEQTTEALLDNVADALLEGRIQLCEILRRTGVENSSMRLPSESEPEPRVIHDWSHKSTEYDPSQYHHRIVSSISSGTPVYRCRHALCTHQRGVWKDIRSRNAHEINVRFHRCGKDPDIECQHCIAVKDMPLSRIGMVTCEHRGCQKVYNRRHAKAHASNMLLHQKLCPEDCEICIDNGWVLDLGERLRSDEYLSSSPDSSPLPSSPSSSDHVLTCPEALELLRSTSSPLEEAL